MRREEIDDVMWDWCDNSEYPPLAPHDGEDDKVVMFKMVCAELVSMKKDYDEAKARIRRETKRIQKANWRKKANEQEKDCVETFSTDKFGAEFSNPKTHKEIEADKAKLRRMAKRASMTEEEIRIDRKLESEKARERRVRRQACMTTEALKGARYKERLRRAKKLSTSTSTACLESDPTIAGSSEFPKSQNLIDIIPPPNIIFPENISQDSLMEASDEIVTQNLLNIRHSSPTSRNYVNEAEEPEKISCCKKRHITDEDRPSVTKPKLRRRSDISPDRLAIVRSRQAAATRAKREAHRANITSVVINKVAEADWQVKLVVEAHTQMVANVSENVGGNDASSRPMCERFSPVVQSNVVLPGQLFRA